MFGHTFRTTNCLSCTSWLRPHPLPLPLLLLRQQGQGCGSIRSISCEHCVPRHCRCSTGAQLWGGVCHKGPVSVPVGICGCMHWVPFSGGNCPHCVSTDGGKRNLGTREWDLGMREWGCCPCCSQVLLQPVGVPPIRRRHVVVAGGVLGAGAAVWWARVEGLSYFSRWSILSLWRPTCHHCI